MKEYHIMFSIIKLSLGGTLKNIIWYILDSAVQCWGYKGAACSDCQESMAEHGEWQNDDCVCADYECSMYHL